MSFARTPPAESPPADAAAERAALSRLRVAANLSGGTPVREIAAGTQGAVAGWWFGLKIWRWGTKVADAVLSVRGASGGLARAIEDFMNGSDIDVARFAIVRSDAENPDISPDVGQRRSIWFFQGEREQRDLLLLDNSAENFLRRLSRRARRNIRTTDREAQRIGLNFAFRERSRSLEIDGAIATLATRNRPAAIPLAHIAMFEGMLAHRPSSFESRITTRSGTLISLCRGFVQGNTAYLVYQINDPIVPRVSLALFHDFKLVEHLIGLGVSELIFIANAHCFQQACRVSSKDELITIRPSPRGLAVACLLGIALRGTRFGDGVNAVLKAILRHWFGVPKAAYDRAVLAMTPPGRTWARGVSAMMSVLVSAAAVGSAVMMREGLGFLSYVTAYPAFLVATYLAGSRIGLLTMALGGIGIVYYVIPPYNSFLVERSGDMWATAIYLITALLLWRWFSLRARSLQTA